MNRVENTKPKIKSIETTAGVFESSTVTYNEAGKTYNTLNTTYGGFAGNAGPKPKGVTIDNQS